MSIALETKGLQKQFGGLIVTRDLSLKLEAGARYACPLGVSIPLERPRAMRVPEDDVGVAQGDATRDLAHRPQPRAAQLTDGDVGAQRADPGAVERGDR